jgi:hypothetical protein
MPGGNGGNMGEIIWKVGKYIQEWGKLGRSMGEIISNVGGNGGKHGRDNLQGRAGHTRVGKLGGSRGNII